MASLSSQMVRLLVDACIAARIDRESLLIAVPPEVAASVPTAETKMMQIMHALFHLNGLSWSDASSHPMKEVLETCRHLARAHDSAELFEVALVQMGEPATLVDPLKERAFYAISTRRMKKKYLDFGCRVTPGIDDAPGPFLVEHPDGRISVAMVSYREGDTGPDVRIAISTVLEWLQAARNGGENAEGYVVLAPVARKADREQVLRAGLHPIDYSEQRSVGLDTVETIVRCLLGTASLSADATFSIVHAGEAWAAEQALAAFFKDFRTQVWLLFQPRERDSDGFVNDLFHVAARSFLQRGAPAPLPIGIDWRARRIPECARDLFTRYGVPVGSMAIEPVLKEGVICPILVCEGPAPSPAALDRSLIPRLLEGMSARSKALVVLSPEDRVAAQHVESSLRGAGWEARVVRAITDVE
jgi:hypothetical protein